jgi:DNA-binding NtrC family response regulator
VGSRKACRSAGGLSEGRVLLVGDGAGWQSEAGKLLVREGYRTERVAELDATLPLLDAGGVRAILVAAGPRAASDVLLLRRVRETAPRVSILVVSDAPTDPDLKRAFEHGATAFLSWPASREALRQAIERGDKRPAAAGTA